MALPGTLLSVLSAVLKQTVAFQSEPRCFNAALKTVSSIQGNVTPHFAELHHQFHVSVFLADPHKTLCSIRAASWLGHANKAELYVCMVA